MGKTVIKITDLSEASIKQAIKEVKAYKKEFLKKTDEVCKRIADRIQTEAQAGFNGAIVDDLTEKSGGAKKAKVKVKTAHVNVATRKQDKMYIVTANGEDAVWVEFGAGVHHNGAVGLSPNPYGNDLGFTIGGFGSNGKKQIWGFVDSDGALKLSRGTPATMPMYKAVQSVKEDVEKIAKEVFG